MSSEDEIRRLRHDLDTLIERTLLISRRLAELEGRESRPAVAAEPLRETAPPLPKVIKMEETGTPSPQTAASLSPPTGPLPSLTEQWVTGPIGRFFEHRVEEFRARTRDLGWEVLLGTYMLPRVAVICISIAVVFFLTLAIERWGATWMPHLRIGMGYAVSATLMFMAWRSAGKYPGFARVLYGGGFAVMYFVTFATYYVEFAKVFVTPVPTLVLLALIVGVWAIAAQLRQSKVIALLVTLLAHFTIFLATLTLDKSGPVSLTGLLAVSAGSAFFLLRNRWYYVASIGLLGAYLNVFVVLAQGEGATPYLDFSVSMGVLIVFFLIFALAELFAPENLRRKAVPGWFRNGFVTFNTTACFLLCTVVMSNYDFSRDYQDLFRFAFGLLLLLLGLAYLRIRSQDPLFNVYMVKSIAILTLALATRYGDERLTAFLAVEMIVLLYAARRSGLIVMRLLAFAVAVIAFHHSMSEALYTTFGGESGLDALQRGMLPYTAPGYSETAFCALLGMAAFLFESQLYQRTNWALLSPQSLPFPAPVLELFWHLDLIADRPSQTFLNEKYLKGFLFPYLFALAGMALFLAYSFPFLHETHRFAVTAGFVLALTILAVLFEAKPFGLAAIVLFVCGLLPMGTHFFLDQESIRFSVAIAGLVALYATALSSEKAYFGQRPGLAFHQQPAFPYLLYGGSAWLTGLLLIKAFSGLNPVFAMIAAAVLCAGFFLLLHPGVFIVLSGGFVFWASILFVVELNDTATPIPIRFRLALVLLTALALSCDRYFNRLGKDRTALTPYLCAGLILNAFLLLLCYFEPRITADWRMAVSALTCFAFLGYAFMFHSPMAAVVSIAGMCYVSCRHSAASFQADQLHPGLVAAFTLAAIFWILSERCYTNSFLPRYEKGLSGAGQRIGFDPSHPATALFPIVFAALLLLIFAFRIPHLAPANLVFITIGWFSVAALLFVLSIPFRQRFYRYTGLVVIFLALARLFLIDMKEQDPLLRVAAFAVAGGGLLVISIGYYKWMARIQPGIRDKGE